MPALEHECISQQELSSDRTLHMQAGLEECVDALVSLMCPPALIEATAHAGPYTRASVRKLLECQDQHGFGAVAALKVTPALQQLAAVRPAQDFDKAHLTSASMASQIETRQHDVNTKAVSSLQTIKALATSSAAGKAAMRPLQGLLSSREPVWRDLQRLQEAASVAALLRMP